MIDINEKEYYDNLKDDYKKVIEDLELIYRSKNNDYGNSSKDTFEKFGLVSFLVRINDKVNRLNTLYKKDARVKESIEDTLLDLANYSIMAVMELRNKKD